MGIASLVLGIIGIISCFIFPIAPIGLIGVIVGLILGIVDVVKKSKTGGKRGAGISGIVICSISFIVLISVIIGIGLFIYNAASEVGDTSSLVRKTNEIQRNMENERNSQINNSTSKNQWKNNSINNQTTNSINNTTTNRNTNNTISSNNNTTSSNNTIIGNTSSNNNQDVQKFNATFKNYEGTRKGASVKTLLQLIYNNNAIESKKITVYYNGSEEDALSVKDYIINNDNYIVEFGIGTDWYFNQANIKRVK